MPCALTYNASNIPEVMKTLAEVIPNCSGDAVRDLNMLIAELSVLRVCETWD
jgi:hypothetical protein